MRKIVVSIGALGILLAAALCTAPAQAQTPIGWVSGVGDDSNPCSRTAPCKTFSGALSKTAAGGEITCLDPGDFDHSTGSTFNITKSITIDCSAVAGYFLMTSSGTGTPAISISGSGITVNLRNLVIDGAGFGSDGISISDAANVVLQNVTIQNFTNRGVVDVSSSMTILGLINCFVIQNGGPGVVMAGASGSAALLQNTISAHNKYGLTTASGNGVTVQNSRTDLNTVAGIEANSGANVYVVGSGIEGNAIGIQAVGGIQIENSDIVGNGTAISGATMSFGNNRVFGNTSAGTTPTHSLGFE